MRNCFELIFHLFWISKHINSNKIHFQDAITSLQKRAKNFASINASFKQNCVMRSFWKYSKIFGANSILCSNRLKVVKYILSFFITYNNVAEKAQLAKYKNSKHQEMFRPFKTVERPWKIIEKWLGISQKSQINILKKANVFKFKKECLKKLIACCQTN